MNTTLLKASEAAGLGPVAPADRSCSASSRGRRWPFDANSFQRLTKAFLAEVDALYTCCRTIPSRGSEERVDVPENRDETQCDKGSRKKKGREAQFWKILYTPFRSDEMPANMTRSRPPER